MTDSEGGQRKGFFHKLRRKETPQPAKAEPEAPQPDVPSGLPEIFPLEEKEQSEKPILPFINPKLYDTKENPLLKDKLDKLLEDLKKYKIEPFPEPEPLRIVPEVFGASKFDSERARLREERRQRDKERLRDSLRHEKFPRSMFEERVRPLRPIKTPEMDAEAVERTLEAMPKLERTSRDQTELGIGNDEIVGYLEKARKALEEGDRQKAARLISIAQAFQTAHDNLRLTMGSDYRKRQQREEPEK